MLSDTRSDYFMPVVAQSNASGAIKFVNNPAPGAGGQKCDVIAMVINAPQTGFFQASMDSGEFLDQWSGGGPAGPLVFDADHVLTVSGSGLLPNTTYTLQLVGIVDYAERMDNWHPLPTGATALPGANTFPVIPLVTGSTSTVARGPFSTTGFGSYTLFINETTAIAGNVLAVTVSFTTLGGTQISAENYIVQAGGTLAITAPNLAPQITVQVIPNATGTYNIAMQLNTFALGPTFRITVGDLFNIWTPGSISATANTTSTVFGTGGPCYAGPALLHVDLAQMAQWVVLVQKQNASGAWSTLKEWDTGAFSKSGASIPLWVPAVPLRFSVTNNTAVTKTVGVALTPDNMRVAA